MKEEKKISFVNIIRRSMSVIFKVVPGHCTIDVSMSVFCGLVLALHIVVTKILFDAITCRSTTV